MGKPPNDVVITGIGIVTSLGVGIEPHLAMLTSPESPTVRVETEKFAPYSVHPLPEIDWSQQIPKRGDQRQMENWQRLGVFTAGLALDDAGLKNDLDACSTMDMIVAAGGGERDIMVDSLIVDEALKRNDREQMLNEKLMTELRPTLFLAQLSNLLAGNISIVHKVTGSSRTFMGEEGAGISAFETAFHRIKSGQSTHCLVGGAFVAERPDMLLLTQAAGANWKGPWAPLWSRHKTSWGTIMLGTVGAFLVLESREHAELRDARIYAQIESVRGDGGDRDNGRIGNRFGGLASGAPLDSTIFSGTTGQSNLLYEEMLFHSAKFTGSAVRAYGGLLGHALEAQFPAGMALAALALKSGALVPPFDTEGEQPMREAASSIVVTTMGHAFAEGMAVLRVEDTGDAR